jgi:hypothetical protein
MSNHSKDKQEQVAIDYHGHYYKIHVFYIKTFEEYLIMEPFIKIFPNVKLILARNLRNGVLDRMIAEYKRYKKYKTYIRKRYYKKEYRKLKDNYMF